MKKLIAILLALVTALSLCACGGQDGNTENTVNVKDVMKNGLQMEDYLTLSIKGCDGYAKLYAELDLERLQEDCKLFLREDALEIANRHLKSETINEYIKKIFAGLDTYDLVEADIYENLSNGDRAEVTVSVPEHLESILSVEIKGAEITYTVRDLEKFQTTDPFATVAIYYLGFASADGRNGYNLSGRAYATVRMPDGTVTKVPGSVDVEEDQVHFRGDTLHVTISEETVQKYRDQYGIDVFTRTEEDVVLEKIDYLPVGDGAREIFEVIDDECLSNVDAATKSIMDDCTESETTVERIGMMFFYDDEGVLTKRNDPMKFYNEIVFIYKITNDTHPNGWYSYMAYNGSVCIYWHLDEDTLEYEKQVAGYFAGHLTEKTMYYQSEKPSKNNRNYPCYFEYEDCKYPGHETLEEVFTSLWANMQGADEYGHLIVTDSLKDYVEEY